MKVGKMEFDQFMNKLVECLRKEFLLDEKLDYQACCRLYNITKDHLQWHITKGEIHPLSQTGNHKKFILKSEMDRLLKCNRLRHKFV